MAVLKIKRIMTLKEKFLPKMYCYLGSGMLTNTYDENVALQNAKECEQIADNYAIEFAEWMSDNATEIQKTGNYKGKYFLLKKGDFFTAKELLKLFKKEKGYE